MNVNSILLSLLMAVIITILALIYKNMVDKESNNKKALQNLKNLVKKVDAGVNAPVPDINSPSLSNIINNDSPSNSLLEEGFEGNNNSNSNSNNKVALQEENEKLKKYLKIHGLYPENHAIDMSKYVLKTAAKPSKVCPDMSKYILKTGVPPPNRCPKINRDDWLRKSELPPNWNKDCPAHPDLTNYVLKTTIPPNQDCPSCICPKVKVNAGLCRAPTKDDCMKMKDVIADACPTPKPCPDIKCPPQEPCPEPDPTIWIKRSELPPDWNKVCPPKEECTPCPRPPPPPKCPEPNCPVCPEPKENGKCPEPERCPPAQNCPKCYDVKYIKVPVVKSEPLPKPNKETIFPTNLIETKLVRQSQPDKPRQPRILSINSNRNSNNNRNNNNRNNINNRNNNLNDEVQEDEELVNTQISEEMLSPSDMALNTSKINMSPALSPMYASVNNNRGNRKCSRGVNGKCDDSNLNNAFKKFGNRGFNNQL